MNIFKNYIKGDKYLWAFIGLLAVFSFLPVYSASSNLVYTVGKGSVVSHMGKHAIFLIVGMLIIVAVQRVNYKYFGGFALIAVIISVGLLAYTLLQGKTIDGANASRWITLPGTSITIQTSTFASMALLIYIARYLTITRNKKISFVSTLLPLFLPMFVIVGLILPANGSTAVILFAMCLVLMFIGGFPIKYLLVIVGVGVLGAGTFIYVALKQPELLPSSRVHTWQSRIENFTNDKGIESYQVHHAKAAINRGGVNGVGPGKSVFKQTLPQSSSDFIFAIIVEEYGIFGAGALIFVYLLILYRITIIATKIHTIFGTLVVCAVGLPVIFQAFINMGVAVNLFPVTGQPLPMISYGGTSMWVTCIAFGIVLSVSRAIMTPEEIKLEERKNTDEVIQDIA
ncbi:MAG: FtsW/RodA/SpoVE family cell cycle protein [Weeksellaceae bacterium]|jgi:cell division protein FtsW|nr:FtsW/RodA/SpoVE family cell cycle protein [Weeksellaceae bacterium]